MGMRGERQRVPGSHGHAATVAALSLAAPRSSALRSLSHARVRSRQRLEIAMLKSWTIYSESEGIMAGRKKKYFKPTRGWVYLIRLFPKDRYKIGFTAKNDSKHRLKSARTWIPEAKLVAEWESVSTWETLARAFVTSRCDVQTMGGSEVLVAVDDQLEVVETLDEFFQRLPEVDTLSAPFSKGVAPEAKEGDQVLPLKKTNR